MLITSTLDKTINMRRTLSTLLKQREQVSFDVVIVGAGPAGLSTAIKLKQLDQNISVCVVDKGLEVGAHILSGGCLESRGLDELIPDWRSLNSPIKTPVLTDDYYILTEKSHYKIPSFMTPDYLKNYGNYIVSSGELVKWLATYAENLGVSIYPSFPAINFLINPKGYVEGIVTGDFGLNQHGEPKDNYQPGIEIKAAQTVLAEGSRGFLAEKAIKEFSLNDIDSSERHLAVQTYSLGFKEL